MYKHSGLATSSATRAVSSAAKRSQMLSQQQSDGCGGGVGPHEKGRLAEVGSLHARSSSHARVAACCRMKGLTPTDGSKTILHKESAQRCGKCSSERDSLDEAPTQVLL